MTKSSIFNNLPGLSVVSNKKDAAKVFSSMNRFYPDAFNFTPKSFCLPEDQQILQEYMSSNPNSTFIVKPQAGSEGCGIFLV